MSRTLKVLISLLVLTIVAVAAFGVGAVFGHTVRYEIPGIGSMETSSTIGEKVDEVEGLLRSEALELSSEDSMTAGAISGLLDSLDDPYALYFDPKQFEYFNEQNDGEFYGIGVTIAERDGTVYVVSVMEDTPAEAAGLQAEDEIVRIDDEAREEWDLDEVVRRIRGPEGTLVEIEVYRPSTDSNEVFKIERAKIEIPNVKYEMKGDDVGYIRLFTFNNHAASDVREAIADLEEQGAKGLILDLRDNPGGLLDVSVDVASAFVDDGVIVRVESRGEESVEHRARGDAVTDAPLVVLVNENSASASEIVAGALQDHERATIMGQTTFGKGSVQTVERLSFGGGVKFTVAHYLTPKGRVIDGIGVEPDIEVEMDPADQAEGGDDIQMKRAIEEVRSQL